MPPSPLGAPTDTAPSFDRVLVVCGDFGDDRCGCGSSEAAFARSLERTIDVLDPLVGPARALPTIWAARGAGTPAMIVYPSVSAQKSPRAITTLGLAVALLRPSQRVVHLHEYVVYDELRWPWRFVLSLFGGDVVVSRASDRAALEADLGSRARRRVRVHLIPPVNATAAPAGWERPSSGRRPGTAGLFGLWRGERGLETLLQVLRRLPPRIVELEAVGDGWRQVDWPADIRERFTITTCGRLPAADLPARIASWEVALTPLADGAHDGRMSVRTPLALGVPTVTTVRDPADLTLRPEHLILFEDRDDWQLPELSDEACRRGARQVAEFEAGCASSMAAVLLARTPQS